MKCFRTVLKEKSGSFYERKDWANTIICICLRVFSPTIRVWRLFPSVFFQVCQNLSLSSRFELHTFLLCPGQGFYRGRESCWFLQNRVVCKVSSFLGHLTHFSILKSGLGPYCGNENHSLFLESMHIVTGPSLTRATFMSAPNSPVPTGFPTASLRALQNCS